MSNYLIYCTYEELLALRNVLYDARYIHEISEVFSQINYYLEGTDIDA